MNFLHEWMTYSVNALIIFTCFAMAVGIYFVIIALVIKIEEPFVWFLAVTILYWSIMAGLAYTIVRAL